MNVTSSIDSIQCYRLVRSLVTSMEQVADELMPQYNQLLTLKKCLGELERWNIQLSPREVVPYRMKLDAIERLVCLSMFAVLLIFLQPCVLVIRHRMMDTSETPKVTLMKGKVCLELSLKKPRTNY